MVVRESNTRLIWIAAVVVSLAVVAFPRFDRQDIGFIKDYTGKVDGHSSFGDAVYYMNYVDFFRGKCDIGSVDLPFRYRPLIPFMASVLPIESPITAIDVLNLLALYATLLVLYLLLRHLGFSFELAMTGCLLYSVSFPVFYLSTTGYLEACSMFSIALGSYCIFREKWFLVALLIAAGTLVKEVVVLLVPVAFVYLLAKRIGIGKTLALSAIFSAAFFIPTAIIKSVFRESGDFYWIPNVQTLLDNLRPRAVASILMSFGLPGIGAIVFLLGFRRFSKGIDLGSLLPLLSGLLVTLMLLVFAMVTAYADGRFAWPSTIFTIPLTLWVIKSIREGRRRTGAGKSSLS
jgi:hypothetical protein